MQPKHEIYTKTIDSLHLARMGLGIAINDQVIISNWLRTGDLIQPFDVSVENYDSYFVVTELDHNVTPAAQEFEAWLRRCIIE